MECRVSEIFASIQGEGPDLGRPAVFLRLSGCNLRCPWCDTKYAWGLGRTFTIDRLVETLLCVLRSTAAKLLVVTGGEPLLQRKCIAAAMSEVKRSISGLRVSLETNGTIPPGEVVHVIDYAVVSPKLGNSLYGGTGDPNRARVADEWFTLYHSRGLRVYWKFVVASRDDLFEVDEFVERFNLDPDDVYLMPLATSVEEQRRILPVLVSHALKRGYRVTPRLQYIAGVK